MAERVVVDVGRWRRRCWDHPAVRLTINLAYTLLLVMILVPRTLWAFWCPLVVVTTLAGYGFGRLLLLLCAPIDDTRPRRSATRTRRALLWHQWDD